MRTLLVAATFALAAPLAAQRAADRPTYWAFVAAGIAELKGIDYAAIGVGAAAQFRRVVVMGRLSSLDTMDTPTTRGEGGLLVGYGTRPAPLHFAAAAGLGIVKGEQDSTAMSVPVEVHATWRLTRWAGLGARGFASFNSNGSFRGITLAVNLGRMR